MTNNLTKSVITVTVFEGTATISGVANDFKVSTQDGYVTLSTPHSAHVLRSPKHTTDKLLQQDAQKLAETLVGYGDIPILTSRGVGYLEVSPEGIGIYGGSSIPFFDTVTELLDFLGDLGGVYLR